MLAGDATYCDCIEDLSSVRVHPQIINRLGHHHLSDTELDHSPTDVDSTDLSDVEVQHSLAGNSLIPQSNQLLGLELTNDNPVPAPFGFPPSLEMVESSVMAIIDNVQTSHDVPNIAQTDEAVEDMPVISENGCAVFIADGLDSQSVFSDIAVKTEISFDKITAPGTYLLFSTLINYFTHFFAASSGIYF